MAPVTRSAAKTGEKAKRTAGPPPLPAPPTRRIKWSGAASAEEGAPSPRLFELLSRRHWKTAIRRALSHPHDAEWRYHLPNDDGILGALPHLYEMEGWAPIHVAIRRRAPPDVVRAVLAAHPASVDAKGARSRGGCTPLHYLAAADVEARMDVLLPFVERFPPSPSKLAPLIPLPCDVVHIVASFLAHPAAVEDCFGNTPLHLLIDRDDDDEVSIRTLASAYPAALGRASSLGSKWTPLHHLVMPPNYVNLGLRQYLIDLADPDALLVTMENGTTPLHFACIVVKGYEVRDLILALLRKEPRAAAVKNEEGQRPLTSLLWSYFGGNTTRGSEFKDCDLQLFEELARVCPEALADPPMDGPSELEWPEVFTWNEDFPRNVFNYFANYPAFDEFVHRIPSDLCDRFSVIMEPTNYSITCIDDLWCLK